jgi:hypothetical protein
MSIFNERLLLIFWPGLLFDILVVGFKLLQTFLRGAVYFKSNCKKKD